MEDRVLQSSRSVTGIKEAEYQVTSSIGPSLHLQPLALWRGKEFSGKNQRY